MLQKNDKVPEFQVVNQRNEQVTDQDLLGHRTIVFFYPKDNTPTCTIEACNLRDHYAHLAELGFRVFGVSADSAKKHTNFIKKFNLPYDLLSDSNLSMIKGFGVWGKKKFMGREYEGIYRTTFVINEEGKIEKVIDDVKSKKHTQQILEALEN